MVRKKKVIALISARLASKRLPNKVLLNYNGKNNIDLIINNLKYSKYIDKIIVATSTNLTDNKLFNYCKSKKYNCFRGHEKNLFKRFYEATKKSNPTTIVRVTGDNPFTSFEITDWMIKKHLISKSDFTHMDKKNLPVGICPEIISFKAIKKMLSLNINFNYSEYLTFYFTNNSKIFKIKKVQPLKNFKFSKNLRLTIDYKKDYLFHKKLINLLNNPNQSVSLKKIYKTVLKNKYLIKINKRNSKKYSNSLMKKIKRSSRLK